MLAWLDICDSDDEKEEDSSHIHHQIGIRCEVGG